MNWPRRLYSCRRLTCVAIVFVALIGRWTTALAQNSGFNASESGTMGGNANDDNLWADSTQHRWLLNNNNHGNLPVAAWPCTAAGCIPISGTTQIGTIYTEQQLVFTGIPGLPILQGTSIPQWGGANANGSNAISLDLQNWASVSEVSNNSTGTSINKLAKITSTGAQILGTSTSDTTSPSYIVVAGNGGTGTTSQLVQDGIGYCVMDTSIASNAEGYYVIASNSSGGECSPVSSLASVAFGTWVIGQVISGSTVAGQAALVLSRSGYRTIFSTDLSNASGTELATATGTLVSGHLASWDASGNAKDSGVISANVTTASSTLTNNLPVIGNGSRGLSSGSASGNTTTFATTTGTLTSGNLASWDGSGNAKDSGLVAANMVSTCAVININSGTASTISAPSSGTTKVYGFYLPCAVSTSNLTFNLNTTDNTANTYDIGVYDNSGTVKVHTGATAGSSLFGAGTGGKNVAWSSSNVLLVPGRYYLAWTTNCSSACAVFGGANFGTFNSGGTGPAPSSGALVNGTMPGDSWTVGLMPTFLLR